MTLPREPWAVRVWTKQRFRGGGVWCECCEKEIATVYMRRGARDAFCATCARENGMTTDNTGTLADFDAADAARGGLL